jgi:putative transcriptional regulator
MKKHGNLSPQGAKIVGALAEFRDALKEGARIDDRFTVRTVELDLCPRVYTAEEVKRVRGLLNLSQPLFARFLGVDVKTVRSWEQGAREPSPMASRFLDEIDCSPDYWRKRLQCLISSKGKHPVES